MERVAIFVDGANFYYGLKSINVRYNDFHFDFSKFFQTLADGRKLVAFWYYTAPIKGNPSLNKDHQVMLSRLRRAQSDSVKLCRRQKIIKPPVSDAGNASYENKMDDVWLSVDMVNDAWKNAFDTAILVSGDGDILPAVNIVKGLKKKVELVGFAERVSNSLIVACGSCKIVDKKIVKKHFLPSRTDSF